MEKIQSEAALIISIWHEKPYNMANVCKEFVVFQINWAILLPAQSFWIILLARFISGIGAAGAITVVSIYNNEVASPSKKASLGDFVKS